MQTQYLNYDQIAAEYNQRYPTSQAWERGQALLELARKLKAKNILEVGSGTGFWLNLLHQVTPHLYGMDFSAGMIEQARNQPAPLKLTQGTAVQIPYQNETFDLIYCVDAIHHFGDHRAFITEAFRVLKPGGALAVIGHDPHSGESNWYIYDYFDTVYETDLVRYPSSGMVKNSMKHSGFVDVEYHDVEHILNIHVGEGVLNDPFIKHSATSQLALLSDKTYSAGIEKIKADLKKPQLNNKQVIFKSDFWVKMFTGIKP
ncbi:MAG: class I SAM-dependent methyltransferase [Anaerolineales bacterium]|nr:class I SAM-dependent methyltransferase [Anaerolineales bacterium]